ncbi:MAG: ATP-binding cassette domain-containing protein [Lachnospiraceae bacterium]|nr:ATP-binding cassette domain-containing protein [Lachnospiraceae bacterium]
MSKLGHRRRKVPTILQVETCECGAVSLAMILAYFGKHVSIEDIRYQCGVTRDGSDAAGMVMAARHYGLEAKGYRKSIENLKEITFPAIVHWDFVHFVVLEGIKGRTYYINDPACGRRKLSLEEFEKAYTGVVLTFEKGEDFVRDKKPKSIPKMVRERLFMDTKATAYIVIAGILLVIPGVVIPMLTQAFIDTIILENDKSMLYEVLSAIALVYGYKILFSFLKSTILAKLQLKLSLITNYQLMYRILRLNGNFYEQRQAGELANRTDNNNQVNSFLAGNFAKALIDLFESFFYLLLMISYSKVLTIIGMAGVLINIIFLFVIAKPLETMNIKYLIDQGKLSASLCAGLSVASTMKANGAEDESAMRMLNSYANTTDSDQRLGRARQILGALPGSISRIVSIVILLVGGIFIMNGDCTTGTLTAFGMLLGSFSESVNDIISMVQSVQTMKANLARVRDIMSADSEIRYMIPDEDFAIRRFSGEITVKDVVYGYNPSMPPTISDINLHVTPGSRLAIVGASGCGKSTLGKIITGLLTPWSGDIVYDCPINEIPQSIFNENVCVINQNAVIFSGTVKDNITFWNKNYSDRDIMEALKCADAVSLIDSLPGGLNYRLEEGGSNLSGGQRQKIQIARAILKNPALILMDEATSALDAITEKRIMENIRCKDCTCVIIAHRLSSIKDADLILVMDKGRIVEQGNHDQLMAYKGMYKELVG